MRSILSIFVAVLLVGAANTGCSDDDGEAAPEADSGSDSGDPGDSGEPDTGDAGRDDAADDDVGVECELVPGGSTNPEEPSTFEFTLTDPPVTFRFTRTFEHWGPGESTTFDVERAAIDLGDGAICGEGSTVAYENSHHNFDDKVSIDVGDVRYTLEMLIEFLPDGTIGWTDTVVGTQITDGAIVFGPVAVERTGGPPRAGEE